MPYLAIGVNGKGPDAGIRNSASASETHPPPILLLPLFNDLRKFSRECAEKKDLKSENIRRAFVFRILRQKSVAFAALLSDIDREVQGTRYMVQEPAISNEAISK